MYVDPQRTLRLEDAGRDVAAARRVIHTTNTSVISVALRHRPEPCAAIYGHSKHGTTVAAASN